MSGLCIKQICSVCSEEVTEADYRRELSCTYAACPGKDAAYHEDCITKYLRKLRLPVSQFVGYQCPAVLENGKPCCGSVTATHHRHPLNQKKKQKRVQAAAAAAAAACPKPKLLASKRRVAAVTAAMRTGGEGRCLEVVAPPGNVAIAAMSGPLPVKAIVKTPRPGSGPAERMMGPVLAISNNSAMAPERVVRQRVIPGWSAPEPTKLDRAKIAALKAEAKAAAGFSAKTPIMSGNSAAGQVNKEVTGGLWAHIANQVVDDDETSEDSSFNLYGGSQRDETENPFFGEGNATPPFDKMQDFILAQSDFPAFTVAAPPHSLVVTPGKAIAPPPTYSNLKSVGAVTAQRQMELESRSSMGSSMQSASPHKPLIDNEIDENAVMFDDGSPASSAVSVDMDEAVPIQHYVQIYLAEDSQMYVKDVNDNYYLLQDVYGASPEVIRYDFGDASTTYYVVVRKSMDEATQLVQQEAAVLVDAHDESTTVPAENFSAKGILYASEIAYASPVVQPAPYPDLLQASGMDGTTDATRTLPNYIRDEQQGAAFQTTLTAMGNDHNGDIANEAEEQSDDLEELFALCMVGPVAPIRMSLAEDKQLPMIQNADSPEEHLHMAVHEMATVEYANGAGYAGDAQEDTGTADDTAAGEDVDSLMQLLCV